MEVAEVRSAGMAEPSHIKASQPDQVRLAVGRHRSCAVDSQDIVAEKPASRGIHLLALVLVAQ